MAFIPPGFGEVTVEMTIPGDAGPAYTVIGVDNSVLGSASDLDLAFQAILANGPGFQGLLPNTVTISKIIARYSPSLGVVEISESNPNIVGFDGSAPPPPQVATLFQKISGLAGRKNRGRMYLPAIQEGSIDGGGFYSGPALSALQSRSDTFLSDCAGSSVPMVILHTSPADTPTPVVSLNAQSKVATQRRRLR